MSLLPRGGSGGCHCYLEGEWWVSLLPRGGSGGCHCYLEGGVVGVTAT